MNPVVWALRIPIIIYRWTLSPMLGPCCRFTPSCSAYALEALATRGALMGSWLTIRRLLRCHPWGGSGWDPVPLPRCRHTSGDHQSHGRSSV
ncbi:MAG: membrane protein insertion efficiency factor YidD [Azospirillaceae bacterium]|nr:membrane protein insertion efficiency factor YidD [Azospirillaceae bacterium]